MDDKPRMKLITSLKYFPQLRTVCIKNIYDVHAEELRKCNELVQKYQHDETVDAQISKLFTPSKTAQNGLNFVTKEEESNLVKKDQPIEIINIFKLVYHLLNEDYSDLPQNQIISNLLTNIFPKQKVDNLKSFYLNMVGKPINISSSQHERIMRLVAEFPKMLNSSELLKINRCISYMTFMIKEILDYTSQKTSEGTLIISIRDARNKFQDLTNKVDTLKALL